MPTDAPKVTVLIADRHRMFRQSLATLLDADGEFQIVGEAATGREAHALALRVQPDIVLLDLLIPDTPGLITLKEMHRTSPSTHVVLLATELGDGDMIEALRLGARGVLMKDSTTGMLFRCLRAVMAGEYWVGRECVAEIVERMRERAFPGDAPPRVPTCGFTPRQLEIVSALVAGATNRDIAQQFSISATTVKYHLSHMFEKAGVSNRLELALFAVQHRLDPSLYEP